MKLTLRLLLASLLVTSATLLANPPSRKKCKEKTPCPCAESASPCGPDSSTYSVSSSHPTDDTDDADEECPVTESQSAAPPYDTDSAPPGITSGNYLRSSINFIGGSPDDVKMETVNGVRVPKQFPIKGATRFYSDLPDGFQITQYINSQLSAPDANGLRSIPAGAQPTTITTYRNPDGGTTTSSGKLDIVHKQRHPQTGAWVTHTIRKVAPQGNNNWTTTFYLGDPTDPNSIPILPYRVITITRTPNTGGTETTHEVTQDRDSSDNLVTTSDETSTYAFYKYGEPVKLSETHHTGTGSELTTNRTYYTETADEASFNQPATIRRSDGQWSNITYQGSSITGTLITKTISGWLDNSAPAIGTTPDEAANRVITEIEANNETGTFSREEKIQGVTVSKTWGERYKDNTGMLVTKSRVETGAATLTTIRTAYTHDASVATADQGKIKSIQYPDGTVELRTHTLQGENIVTTADHGVGTLGGVTDGTRTVSTSTKDETLIKEVVSDIASGIVLATREAIAFDANSQPSRWAYDNNPDDYSETLNGCCGIDSVRNRDGITTSYTRDGLKRPKTAISQGITLTYTYGKKTIGGTDFPSENITATSGSLTLSQGTTIHDLAGNVIQQISPDLDGDSNEEITDTVRDYAAHSTTTTQPDGGTMISTGFADGQSKSTTGTATAPRYYSYSTHSEQGGGELTATAPTATGPWTRSYENLASSSLKTTFDDGTETTLRSNTYDNLGRLISTVDADGVTSLLAYNAKGEAYRRAIDLNQNGEIDATDRVSDSIRDVADISGFGPAIRSRSIVYDDSNTAITLSTTLQSPDGLTSRQETLGVADPSTSISASYTDRADGAWTDSSTAPDGTKQVTEYSNWLAIAQEQHSNLESSSLMSSVSYGYDALRRQITRTHSRTGLVTTNYATSGQVSSIDDHGRVTSFAYDNMGRRTSTTLPDSSITHTSYWLTGQVKSTWGSQTNPIVNLYDSQGRQTALRSFRSDNLALAPDETTGSYDETTWTYNDLSQLTRKEYADGKGTDYTYTAAGKLHTRTWARGVVTTYGYNTAGALTTTDYSDDTPDVTISYDKLGRKISVTQTNQSQIAYTYDPSTLSLDTETVSYDLDHDGTYDFTRVLDRSLDTLSRNTGFELKDGSTIENQASYGYSATDGRVSQISNPQISDLLFTYSYLPNSSLIASVTGSAHSVTNSWEATRNVLATKLNKVGTDAISQYDYTVNAIGQRSALATSGSAFPATPSWGWGYDSLGQIISADSSNNSDDRAYQYDSIGNRIEARDGVTTVTGTPTYTANALNQYTSVNAVNPVHDFDGNMTSGPLPVSPTTSSTLVWDAENRLIEAKNSSNVTIETNLYDAQSRLISRSAGVSPTSSTLYLYDGFNCIAEYTGTTPTVSKTRLWGIDLSGSMQGAGGVGGLLAETQGSDNYFPTYDGNGNVSEYLDSSGVVQAHYEYDAFGNTIVASGTKVSDFAYCFSTKPLDSETGLYYYGYRYYDPLTGRWPSRDPIGEKGGRNLYGFVGNDGVDSWDNFGLFGDWTGFGYWLTGKSSPDGSGRTGGTRQIKWSDFDPSGSTRDSISLGWKQANRSNIRSHCDKLKPGETASFKVLGEFKMRSTNQDTPWIGDYDAIATGATQWGDNVDIEKYVDSNGSCPCNVYASVDLDANDTSDFNAGQGFGPGDIIRDQWFIWIRDYSPIFGYDYKIFAFENRQIAWTEK